MDKTIETLINKFIQGKRLTNHESVKLEKLLDDNSSNSKVMQWLETKWQESAPEIVSLRFEQLRQKIKDSSIKYRFNRLFIAISRVAAVLIVPLLAASLYFYFSQTSSDELLTLSTQKGEQTSVILPDGSKVWLNVDTKLSYPIDYGIGSRNLELEGEAYFEVAKNKELPFEVTSGKITTKALGTRFVVSAYPESPELRSSLIEGSVEIGYGIGKELLKPGQQFVYDKNKANIVIKHFDEGYALAWKNDQLVFHLTPFDEVVVKLEQWYNVTIEYDPALFKSETLTVRFEKYESFEKVLEITGKANGFKYSIENNNVKLLK